MGWFADLFRRGSQRGAGRSSHAPGAGRDAAPEVEEGLSPERLEQALQRLRTEIPSPDADQPPAA